MRTGTCEWLLGNDPVPINGEISRAIVEPSQIRLDVLWDKELYGLVLNQTGEQWIGSANGARVAITERKTLPLDVLELSGRWLEDDMQFRFNVTLEPEEEPALVRHCNGGNGPGRSWCGKPATVVVSAFERGVDDPRPLQWYACDDVAHHAYSSPCKVTTEPIGAFLARCRI